jgi:flagellar protein FlgJ
MFDSQMAVSLSSGKGIGLAEVIRRQLAPAPNPASNADHGSADRSLAGYDRSLPPMQRGPALEEALATVNARLDRQPVPPTGETTLPVHFDSPGQFIEALYPLARQVEQESGLDARLMLAQSALETGWGRHPILREDGLPSHNLFGIKAGRDWQGDSATITTTEYRGGLALREQAAFRAYDSYQDSFRDYAQFLKQNDRYQEALALRDDPKAFARALQDSGYATDPRYGDKIARILDRYLSDSAALGRE